MVKHKKKSIVKCLTFKNHLVVVLLSEGVFQCFRKAFVCNLIVCGFFKSHCSLQISGSYLALSSGLLLFPFLLIKIIFDMHSLVVSFPSCNINFVFLLCKTAYVESLFLVKLYYFLIKAFLSDV